MVSEDVSAIGVSVVADAALRRDFTFPKYGHDAGSVRAAPQYSFDMCPRSFLGLLVACGLFIGAEKATRAATSVPRALGRGLFLRTVGAA